MMTAARRILNPLARTLGISLALALPAAAFAQATAPAAPTAPAPATTPDTKPATPATPAATPGQAAPVVDPATVEREKRAKERDDKFPTFVITTSLGEIVVELNREAAPISVANFIKYVDAGFYAGTTFHRLAPGFVIQGGGMDEQGKQKPTLFPPIKNEWTNGLKNARGTIAMARTSAPDSATSQFYFNLSNNQNLDTPRGGAAYAVFGKVIAGLNVVDTIASQPRKDPNSRDSEPAKPIVIASVLRLPPALAESVRESGKYDPAAGLSVVPPQPGKPSNVAKPSTTPGETRPPSPRDDLKGPAPTPARPRGEPGTMKP